MSWCALFCILLLFVCVSHTSSNRKKKEKSYYDILEIQQNATQREIRKAYFALVKIYHPDKNELYDEKKKIKEQFELISNAYEILSDEEKRTEYDRLLELGQTEYKESHAPKQTAETENIKFKFKDPYKAYEDALKKEEEEAWREKIFTVSLVIFVTGTLLFAGYIGLLLLKRTRFYQKMEKQKQEQENRKNIVEVKKKRTEKTEKEKKQLQQQDLRLQEIRKRRLENRANIDYNKVTKWAGDDEEDSEDSDKSTSSGEEEQDNGKSGSGPRKTHPEMEKSKTDIYCMACHKLFKSTNQWENHELSKKHKTDLEKLKGQEKELYFKKLKEIKKYVEEEKRKKIIQPKEEQQEGEDGEVGQEKPESLENGGIDTDLL